MLKIRPCYMVLGAKFLFSNMSWCIITFTNGQQPQEPSRSWQQVVSSGHSDSWSGQMTAFTLCSSWSHHTSQPTHINDGNTKKRHVNGRIESYSVVETVLRSFQLSFLQIKCITKLHSHIKGCLKLNLLALNVPSELQSSHIYITTSKKVK